MRKIFVDTIIDMVCENYIKACCEINDDVLDLLICAHSSETTEPAKDILAKLIQNAHIAKSKTMPICQDTGMAVCFVEFGQSCFVADGCFTDAVNSGISKACMDGFLRASVVADPFRRHNTKNNTPAVIITDFCLGDQIKVTLMPKGFGSENMSALKMFEPSDTDVVWDFVVETVKNAGSKPCPPVFVGVGLGGTADHCMTLAKKALLRDQRCRNTDPFYALKETQLFSRINQLPIGVQGFGGNNTCLAVAIEACPTHIAALPCAVNISCHALRRVTFTI